MKRTLLAFAAGCALSLALVSTQAAEPRTVTVARGLQNPWALAFLPDGRMLVTEKAGRLRIVAADGSVGAPLAGLPKVDAGGQGGLLDVVVDPRFGENRRIYWSYSEPGDGGNNGTAVARATLDGNTLSDVQVIFRQAPKHSGGSHFGSRLVFDRSGALFVTLGDRFSLKEEAQQVGNHIGKIVRITTDGQPAPGNPFAAGSTGAPAGALPELWSYGHRNVQGAALHPATGELWATEHGPQGGDELNRVEKGRNHGWPVITYGRNYGLGTRIGEGEARDDVVPPLRHWVPVSIAPSGLAFLTSERYPGWQGNLFMGALRGQALLRLQLDGSNKVVSEERLLTRLGERIRDVRQGSDGWLYVLTDNADGRILRLQP
ncbi:PQQ-dependent sugar dehydrogenase [Aquincola tertiaricarbonis]|uniref:PQQ-dependent sugar dehydrogenase n=1 Tax=Aquincola tertiaricarbonis TaxID=391953 RepID=UPI000614A540|nr:PQQ-dependent sugar dehydrogenase [Aquincola tertiaricarbonis]